MTPPRNPRRLGLLLLPLWVLCAGTLWPRLATAMTMAQYVRAFDWASLATALGIAVVGGTGPTLLALLTDRFVLQGVLARTAKDIGLSGLAGVVFFVAVVAIESTGYDVPDGLAFAGLLCAGWARREFFGLVGDGLRQLWGALVDRVVGKVRGTPPT